MMAGLPHYRRVPSKSEIEAEKKLHEKYRSDFDEIFEKFNFEFMNDWGEIFIFNNEFHIRHDYVKNFLTGTNDFHYKLTKHLYFNYSNMKPYDRADSYSVYFGTKPKEQIIKIIKYFYK